MNCLVSRKVMENNTQGFHHWVWWVISVWIPSLWRMMSQLERKNELPGHSKAVASCKYFYPKNLQHHLQATYQMSPGSCFCSYELPAIQAENRAIVFLPYPWKNPKWSSNPQESFKNTHTAHQDKSSCWSSAWNVQWALEFVSHLLERTICSSLCWTSALCCKSLHLWQMISKHSQPQSLCINTCICHLPLQGLGPWEGRTDSHALSL